MFGQYLLDLILFNKDNQNQVHVCNICIHKRYEITLNYRVIVERYLVLNGLVGGSNPVVKSSLYLTEKKETR